MRMPLAGLADGLVAPRQPQLFDLAFVGFAQFVDLLACRWVYAADRGGRLGEVEEADEVGGWMGTGGY